MIELSLGVNTYGFVDSKVLLINANGDFDELPTVNSFTLGLKSINSVALSFPTIGISFENLSFVYELTEKKSPLLPLATWYLSNITNNCLDGIPTFDFLTIFE